MKISIFDHGGWTYVYLNGKEFCYRKSWQVSVCRALLSLYFSQLLAAADRLLVSYMNGMSNLTMRDQK